MIEAERFAVAVGERRGVDHPDRAGLDRRLGDDLELVVLRDQADVVDRRPPVVGEGQHPGGRAAADPVGEQALAGQVAGADPQLVVGLPDGLGVVERGLVADVEPHRRPCLAPPLPGRTNWGAHDRGPGRVERVDGDGLGQRREVDDELDEEAAGVLGEGDVERVELGGGPQSAEHAVGGREARGGPAEEFDVALGPAQAGEERAGEVGFGQQEEGDRERFVAVAVGAAEGLERRTPSAARSTGPPGWCRSSRGGRGGRCRPRARPCGRSGGSASRRRGASTPRPRR